MSGSFEDICDLHPIVQLISELSGGVSFTIWLVAQLPQTIEIYQNKSVDGISPIFILSWFIGDFTSFIGCLLTSQLPFQIVIASYFLLNDIVLCGQYYYYKYLYETRKHYHHHHHHDTHKRNSVSSRKSTGSLLTNSVVPAAVVVASNIQTSNALPIIISSSTEFLSSGSSSNSRLIGVIAAWIGAGCYFFARIPQLVKNHKRKSTQDISPFLFGCTLAGNITYTISILTSCEFLFSDGHRLEFFLNELPYIIGSSGTIVFDIFYFYQVWLYREKSDDDNKSHEETPLLRSSD